MAKALDWLVLVGLCSTLEGIVGVLGAAAAKGAAAARGCCGKGGSCGGLWPWRGGLYRCGR